MDVRDAEEVEIDQLAKLWYDGWRDAHARIVPEQLTRLRTHEPRLCLHFCCCRATNVPQHEPLRTIRCPRDAVQAFRLLLLPLTFPLRVL
jgi:hypothetical protein